MDIKESLANTGTAMSQMPSGIPIVKYYRPDGREEIKTPQYHTRKDGVVYDIFLGQGYSLTPPENPKPSCVGCNGWHNTEGEVKTCIKERKRFMAKMNQKAREDLAKERKGKDTEISELKAQVEKLTKLMEATLGKAV